MCIIKNMEVQYILEKNQEVWLIYIIKTLALFNLKKNCIHVTLI